MVEEHGGDRVPRRSFQGSVFGRFAEPLAQICVVCQSAQGVRQADHVVRDHQQTFSLVRCQKWEIASAPTDDGQPEGHRLAVYRPERLLEAGQRKGIYRRVHRRDLAHRQRSVDHHAIAEPANQRPDVTGVRGFHVGAADQVQRGSIGLEERERLEQIDDALALHPVADAEQRDSPAMSQIPGRVCWHARYVTPWWDDRDVQPPSSELGRQRVAGHHDCGQLTIGESVQDRLGAGAQRSKVNAAWWLVQHARTRLAWPTQGEAPRHDAVHHDDVRLPPLDLVADSSRVQQRKRKGSFRERSEFQRGVVARGQFSQAPVEQITAGELCRVAERDQDSA